MGLLDISQGTAKRIEIDVKLVSMHDSQRGEVKKFVKGETIEIVCGEIRPKLDIRSDGPSLGSITTLFRGGFDRACVIDLNRN